MEIIAHTLSAESSSSSGFTQVAVRLLPPEDVNHTPTHYILLIDVSLSMMNDNKLNNVKKCLTTLVNFLKPEDTCSLITFGDNSEIHLNRVKCDASSKESIRTAIQEFIVDGSTNLSAGLLNVKSVLRANEKSGLLLLTDGHANNGVRDTEGLIEIFKKIVEEFPRLSIASIGYGTDHNADLLKAVAEETLGKYTIVDSIDTTAFAFGDVIGGLMSCYAQLTTLVMPMGSKIHGPYTIKNGTHVLLGDIYAGTKTLLLLDVPTAELSNVSITATVLPGLESINKKLTYTPLLDNDTIIEVELTRLRFECTELLKLLRTSLSADMKASLKARVDAFESALSNEKYASHPITQTLKHELPLMREVLNANIMQSQLLHSMMSQHETSIGLARGFSSPVRPMRSRPSEPPRIVRRRVMLNFDDDDEPHFAQTPTATSAMNDDDEDESVHDPTTSVFQNTTMRAVASALLHSTQNPDGV